MVIKSIVMDYHGFVITDLRFLIYYYPICLYII
jgi:hypothetical protein